VEQLLYTRLTTDIGVAALVGTRVYPLILPQDPILPAVVYRRISTGEFHTHDEAGGLRESRVQVDCLAQTYAGAKQIATAVLSSLNGWLDRDNDILACLLQNEFEVYEDITGISRIIIDFMIKYRS
jgi:hypothetical protein